MGSAERFEWPSGKRCAISITFDDARQSQLDAAIPILDRYGVKASFYVSLAPFEARLDGWRAAAHRGHEIGNHSTTHPCSGNFKFSRHAALEEYDLDRIRADIAQAGDRIESLIGRRPVTFAYPCGQKYVGRGIDTRSYVPVVAESFLAGRGFREEYMIDPAFADLAQLAGIEFDGMTEADLTRELSNARDEGKWLILAGHEVGEDGYQTVPTPTLEVLCRKATDPESGIWCATVEDVARYIIAQRAA